LRNNQVKVATAVRPELRAEHLPQERDLINKPRSPGQGLGAQLGL
jgi:hypothetical protein